MQVPGNLDFPDKSEGMMKGTTLTQMKTVQKYFTNALELSLIRIFWGKKES